MDYQPGDFSFVKEYQYEFEYDYKVINKIGELAWNKLKKEEKNDYIMEIINESMYPAHIATSYRLSLNNLIYIARNGWKEFVKKYFKETGV